MPDSRPNILIFMTDQQRGATVLPDHPAKTPNLDRFRDEAVTFTNARCPSPHCCPSRASFFSGLMPTQHGVWNNIAVQNTLSRGLNEGVRLWSQDLVEAGYRCTYSGKWHVDADRNPADFGWEEHPQKAYTRKAEKGSGWDGYARMAKQGDTTGDRVPGGVRRPGYGDYTHYGINEDPFGDAKVTADGIAAIKELAAGNEPWSCYIGTLGPHDPYMVPQRFLDMYDIADIPLPSSFHDRMADKPALYRKTRALFDQLTDEEHREAIRHYYAFCTYEDYLFGQVLGALADTGQAENTLVLYCSDHGDYLGDHGLWCKGLPCFKGAYEIPFIMRWPAGMASPGRACDLPVSLTDVAPTMRSVAGIDSREIPGASHNLHPILRGEEPLAWRKAHFTQTNGNEIYGMQRSVDNGQWKYVWNGYDDDELYDLANDPDEMCNLAADPRYADIRDELCADMWAFGYHHDEQFVNGYIMIAHAPVGPASAFVPGTDTPRPLTKKL